MSYHYRVHLLMHLPIAMPICHSHCSLGHWPLLRLYNLHCFSAQLQDGVLSKDKLFLSEKRDRNVAIRTIDVAVSFGHLYCNGELNGLLCSPNTISLTDQVAPFSLSRSVKFEKL